MVAAKFCDEVIAQAQRVTEGSRPGFVVVRADVLVPVGYLSVQHAGRAAGRVLRIQRLVDIDHLAAGLQHFADPAGAAARQSGHDDSLI